MEEDSLNKSASSSENNICSLKTRFELKKQKLKEINGLLNVVGTDGNLAIGATKEDLARKLLLRHSENRKLKSELESLRRESRPPVAPDAQEYDKLKEKYAIVVNQLQAARHDSAASQKSIEDMKTLVAKEIGPDDPSASGWQGRAAEITQLRQRIRVLESAAAHPNAPVVVVDQKRVTELTAETASLRSQLADMSRAKLALKSRVDTLEQRLVQSKEDVGKLLEKNDLNDRLIAKLESYLGRVELVTYNNYSALRGLANV